ncbi:triose-phosphate isomerase [candidate division CSSED10-310 bacterium]|uniref:Triosephosphate isomerase n=1 Tax=candidate division CSSED10-310 bacterium TaxID=2855610 RepID=A0ABV6YYV4_UNCC1
MRRSLIAANWKMHKKIDEGLSFITGLKEKYPRTHPVEVVICAPFTMLFALAEKALGSGISIGAQNLYWEKKGAYTGETSGQMIVDAGCEYVIIGHSERRQYFHETNVEVNKKIKAAHAERLNVIFCIGESLTEREAGQTFTVVQKQLIEGLEGISEDALESITLAYEPIWAIGTGVTATPEQAGEVHTFIRKLIREQFSDPAAEKMRILYGGSVKPGNVDQLMALDDIDGGLVGGASLELSSFLQLINFKSS